MQTEDVNKIKEDPIKAQRVQSKFNRKNNQRKVDKHILVHRTAGQLIGEDDVRLGIHTYSTTAKCISQTATLLKIGRDDFVQKLQNQTATWSLLSSQVSKTLKEQQAHMRATNQARERISPHLKKNDESDDARNDAGTSAERPSGGEQAMAQKLLTHRTKNLKSTANYSAASNEDL